MNENDKPNESEEPNPQEESEPRTPPALPPKQEDPVIEPVASSEEAIDSDAVERNNPEEMSSQDKFEPLEGAASLGGVVDALLKHPTRLLYEWQEGRQKAVIVNLSLISVAAFLLFGFLLGHFSGGTQLWAVPVKVLAGALISALITLPSLYVFSSLGGLDMTLQRAAGLLVTGIALVGLILLALAPVLWIFTQSTDSIGFMGFLVLLFWIAALGFGMKLILSNAKTFGSGSTGYLLLWVCIFVTVTLQMSTSLRPLLGPAEETFLPTEKRFFLEHWSRTMTEGPGDTVYR